MQEPEERVDEPMFWEPSLAFLRLSIRLTLVGASLFLVALAIVAPEQTRRASGPAALIVLAAVAWFLLSRGRVRATVRVLAIGVWAVAIEQAFSNGGVRAPVMILFPQVILLTGWLWSPRAAMTLAILSSLAALGLGLAEARAAFHLPPPSPPLLYCVVQGTVFVSAAVLIRYLVASYRNRIAEVRGLGLALEARAADLADKEREIRLVAESVPAMIYHGDREQRCLYANRSYAEFYGASPEDLEKRTVREIVGESHHRLLDERLGRVLAGERLSFREALASSTGDERAFDVDLVPELGADGRPKGFFAVLKDVTEEAFAEEALRRLNQDLEDRVAQRTEQLLIAKNEAERASEAKSEFLSRMSHELRTPLNAILGFSQLLEVDQRHVLAAEQAENVREILRAGGHLLGLIDEVLDLSRVESGRLDLVAEPVDLRALFEACARQVEPVARDRGVRVSIDADASGSAMADEQRLRQVLLNLLSNGVKYNRDGGEVTLGASRAASGRARIEVRDTGRGIEPTLLPRLFQPFERLDASREIEGTGIGLAISKRLVEAMGGTLGVDSEPGVGSTFWLELERAR